MDGGADISMNSNLSQPGTKASPVRRLRALVMRWRRQAQRVQKEAHVFYLAFRHPGTPWYAKLVAACSAGYLFSPIQLIPNYIPGIGFLDDLAVLFLGSKLIQKLTPPEVLRECRERAETAEIRRREGFRSVAAVVVPVVIVALWLLVAIAVSRLVVAHLLHR